MNIDEIYPGCLMVSPASRTTYIVLEIFEHNVAIAYWNNGTVYYTYVNKTTMIKYDEIV